QHLRQANFFFSARKLFLHSISTLLRLSSPLPPEEAEYSPRKETRISHLSLFDLSCRELQLFKALSQTILGTSICSQIMRIFCFPNCLLFYSICNLFSEVRFLALTFLNRRFASKYEVLI
ncbi:hypothetical protein GIB67_006498, partial [Kingdonia uniflora]